MRTNELHASAKQIGRSSGRSSVAAAAYRSGELLRDERTGLTHDYTKKSGVEYSRVYTPYNAPEELRDREKLWNAVEKKENRKNSCVAHELEIAFPHEFNAMQRREAGDSISRELMNRYNCAVDIALHHPNKEGDERNFHAHILFTTRGFDEGSKDGWSKNKFRDLAADKITVDGEATTRGKEEVKALRKFTAGEMNRIAERDKLEVKTEHLSFEARGIEKEPTKKMGYAATQAERRGVKTDRGDINRSIKASNDNLGSNTAQLNEQRKVLLLDKRRALLALQQEESDRLAGQKIAGFGEHYLYHEKQVTQATSELIAAKGRLERISILERFSGQRWSFEADILKKEESLEAAQKDLDDLKRKVSSQPMEHDLDIDVTAARTAQYKQKQGEVVALQAQFENRNNIEKIIGAITGKTREQNARIEELQDNIKSYEADKRLDEIKLRQNDLENQEIETHQRDKDRFNDNKITPSQDKTKEHNIEDVKQKYLDDMAQEREEKAKQEALQKGYDYQPMSERRENKLSLSDAERKEGYLERMNKQREQEAAHKEKERAAAKVEYDARPENDPLLSNEERKKAYLDRMSCEREVKIETPEIDKGDRGRD